MYTVYTNDQQLYKVTVQMTWWHMAGFEHFIPRLGGMQLLISLIVCVEVLMAESALLEVMQAAFSGVKHMLNRYLFAKSFR